jgi:nonsense-mediated mRNA decay protein 3
MFCVECGKETEILRKGMCIPCYIESKCFSKGPPALDIYMCSKCRSYKYKNTWLQEPVEEILMRHVRDSFEISKELEKIQIKAVYNEKKPCTVVVSGFLENHEIEEQHLLNVNKKTIMCDVCSKQYGGYYEAILQIRADRRKPTQTELETIRSSVENLVENLRAKGNRSLFITDVAEEHGVLDFYISEKGCAYTIARKIQEQHGGVIKQSSKNFGIKDGRQIYRMTYLVRLPAYQKGDFVSIDGSYFYVSSISGNKVHVIELPSWKEQVLDEKELQKANIHGGEELIKEMILVSQTKDEIQIMDPTTYKTFYLKKPKGVSFDLKTVYMVKLEDEFFLTPQKP